MPSAESSWKDEFLQFCVDCEVLRFGEFTLKSGRSSPYFFNAGLFNTGGRIAKLGRFYARAIAEAGLEFDVLFGPAYKGIPLATSAAIALSEHHSLDVPCSYNRKEAKDHGAPALPVSLTAPRAAPAGAVMSAADGMEGAAHETGFKVWDPLGLADLGSPATLAWFRHAELKHSRVCMAAFTGWLVAVSGIHFPGQVSLSGLTFEDLSKLGPMEQWQALPGLGKFQIILAIGIIEHQSEWKIKPHYMAGGTPGSLKGLKNFWDPVGLTAKMDAKKLERQRLSEIKNGRAAMLGITSVLIAKGLPGAIPLPIDFPAGGLVMPF